MKNTLQSVVFGLILMLCGGQAWAQQYIVHIAGARKYGHGGDSARALQAELRCPMSVCRGKGNKGLYIGDGGPLGYNNDACIRYISDTGIIYTIAGRPGIPDSANNLADGIPATAAKLQGVAGICLDQFGNLLIADGKSMVKRINMTEDTLYWNTIETVAGRQGSTTSTGDWGPAVAATLDEPYDVAVDAANNIYICERGKHVIRKIFATNDTIMTFAGRYSAGFTGDGGAAVNAKLNDPRGIHIRNNTLYIADYGNNRVRAVNLANGIITTVAGSSIGYDGDGGLAVNAKLTQPVRVTTDLSGNLYIADAANQRIRKVEASTGIISTYAGNGEYFFGPDVVGNDGPATAASLVPYGMCTDNCGNLYVGSPTYSVRAITVSKPKKRDSMLCSEKILFEEEVTLAKVNGTMKLFPDPNSGRFTLRLTADRAKAVEIVITDITGRRVKQMTGMTNRDLEVELNVAPGMYMLQAIAADERWSSKVVVE